uniref:Uncharacterized protein n=1 Tax=Timema monikensis TaxID=170555 RepID=A0A7R9EKC2_9NEOP|nr:unnamed protein product [Timema monikensis]
MPESRSEDVDYTERIIDGCEQTTTCVQIGNTNDIDEHPHCQIKIIQDLLGSLLMVLVTIGYKTKLSALILVLLLAGLNLYHNACTSFQVSTPRFSTSFQVSTPRFSTSFQTLSVIGGLLMIVYLGPGGVSMDEHKKKW